MTQSQVAAHLADKVNMSKKDAKVALEELTALEGAQGCRARRALGAGFQKFEITGPKRCFGLAIDFDRSSVLDPLSL